MDTQAVVGIVIITGCLLVIYIPELRAATQYLLDATLGRLFGKKK